MSASPELIRERMPVWDALSEFFLDTELQDDDHKRIARVLARSPYSEVQLWEILRFEVYPPCHLNLLCVAGEWAMFGEDWLMERVAPRCDRRPRFYWPMLHWWMFRHHWRKVRDLIRDIRGGEQVAAPNSRPPSQLPTSPGVQSSDSQRTSSSGGCG
jgi:hypothetical protein